MESTMEMAMMHKDSLVLSDRSDISVVDLITRRFIESDRYWDERNENEQMVWMMHVIAMDPKTGIVHTKGREFARLLKLPFAIYTDILIELSRNVVDSDGRLIYKRRMIPCFPENKWPGFRVLQYRQIIGYLKRIGA